MMLIRKNGETHKQYISRLQGYIGNLESNNRALRIQNSQLAEASETHNPRTMVTYKQEAQQLFITVALVEHAIRNPEEGSDEFLKALLQGQLDALGFSLVDIYEGKCLQDNAYNEK